MLITFISTWLTKEPINYLCPHRRTVRVRVAMTQQVGPTLITRRCFGRLFGTRPGSFKKGDH